jgi:hypothetical protein
VAGFPRFEFTGHVFAPRRAQLGNDDGILCGEQVLKLIERSDGRENGGGNFNGFPFHGGILSRWAGDGKSFLFMAFPAKNIFAGCGVG